MPSLQLIVAAKGHWPTVKSIPNKEVFQWVFASGGTAGEKYSELTKQGGYSIWWMYADDWTSQGLPMYCLYESSIMAPAAKVVYNKPQVPKKDVGLSTAEPQVSPKGYGYLTLDGWKEKVVKTCVGASAFYGNWKRHPLDSRLYALWSPSVQQYTSYYLEIPGTNKYQQINQIELKTLGYDYAILCKSPEA